MKRILLPFLLTFILAGELEVDGNLKVSCNIDAQNKAIKNVGIPTDMNDAINAEVLQNALRDDGPFEYKLVATRLTNEVIHSNGSFTLSYKNYGETSWSNNFESYLNTLEDSGWNIYKTLPYTYNSNAQMSYNYYIFRRPIED